MSIKKLFIFLSCAAIFCFTFSASAVVAQTVNEDKSALSDALFPKGIAGEWRLDNTESDDVIAKLREALERKNNAANDDKKETANNVNLPAISILPFPAETLILDTGNESEITIKELFADVIETRKMLTDGTRREFEIAVGAKFSVIATQKNDRLTIETVSPRGNKMIETFALAPESSRLIVTLRIEDSRALEIFTLRRVYERALPDSTLY